MEKFCDSCPLCSLGTAPPRSSEDIIYVHDVHALFQDTLFLMGMMDEFESGREWIEEKFDMNKMSGNQERNLNISLG